MANTSDYYRKNHLYTSHRMFVPEAKERSVNTCRNCRFYITIVGREARKKGCAAIIPKYYALERRIPAEIDILLFLREVGKVGLAAAVNCCGEQLNACGLFQPQNGATNPND